MTSPTRRTPRQLGADDLVLNHFTLGRTHPLADRFAAAAAAGYAGVGLFVGEFLRLQQAEGFDLAQLADLLDEHGLVLADIEVVRVWNEPGQATDVQAAFERTAWALADRFECRYLQAIGPTLGEPPAETAAAFAGLCDRAADHGLTVGLEFLPFTDLVDAADVMRVVDAADRPNGGVCLDIWHHARGANDVAMLEAIGAERIMAVQMSDGPAQPVLDSYYEDCLRCRQAPGTGEMDAVGFVRRLLRKGVRLPWSIEACNDTVWDGPGAWAHVQRCADGMRSVLAAARAAG